MKNLLPTTIAAMLLVGSVLADPIHDAARGGDLAGVQAELDKGTDVNTNDAFGTPLHYGARYGHRQIIEFLIHKGADVNAEKTGVTPLHWASRGNFMQIAELLIAEDADVNAKSDLGETSLDWANKYNQGNTAALLRKHGGRSGSIHGAARDGDIEAVKDFLASGTDVNKKDDKARTALHFAANQQIAKFLVSNEADINAKSNNGLTPLHYAADLGYRDIVELLIANGADVSLKTKWGQPPIQNAACSGHKEIVELLIAAGADVNNADDGGWTPLHEAVDRGHIEVVELLIEEGADINAKDEDGITPLLRELSGPKEMIELLITEGADVNVMDGNGRTALDRAIDYPEIVALLLKHGGKAGEELALMPRLSDIRTYWERVQLIELVINGKVGLKCGVLYSTDLKEWHVLDTVTLEASPQVYVDKSAEQCPHWCLQPMRFYRVKLVE